MTTQTDKYYQNDIGVPKKQRWTLPGSTKKALKVLQKFTKWRVWEMLLPAKRTVFARAIGVKKHDFHVAQRDYRAMHSVCVYVCGDQCGGAEILAKKVEIRW